MHRDTRLSAGHTWFFFSCNKCSKKSVADAGSYRCSSCLCRAAKPRYYCSYYYITIPYFHTYSKIYIQFTWFKIPWSSYLTFSTWCKKANNTFQSLLRALSLSYWLFLHSSVVYHELQPVHNDSYRIFYHRTTTISNPTMYYVRHCMVLYKTIYTLRPALRVKYTRSLLPN